MIEGIRQFCENIGNYCGCTEEQPIDPQELSIESLIYSVEIQSAESLNNLDLSSNPFEKIDTNNVHQFITLEEILKKNTFNLNNLELNAQNAAQKVSGSNLEQNNPNEHNPFLLVPQQSSYYQIPINGQPGIEKHHTTLYQEENDFSGLNNNEERNEEDYYEESSSISNDSNNNNPDVNDNNPDVTLIDEV
jgi:hypothetical protein